MPRTHPHLSDLIFSRLRAELDESRHSTRAAMGRATKAEAKVRTLNAHRSRADEESKRLSSDVAAEVARHADARAKFHAARAEFHERLLALERINAKLIAQGRAFWDECDVARATLIARANAHVDAADRRSAQASGSAMGAASSTESTRSRLKLQRRASKGLRGKVFTAVEKFVERSGGAGGGDLSSGGSAPRSVIGKESAAEWSMRVRRQHGNARKSHEPVNDALVGLEIGGGRMELLDVSVGGSAFAPTADVVVSNEDSQAAAYPGESQFGGALDAASELDADIFHERFGAPARRARHHRDIFLSAADEEEVKLRAWDREALESREAACDRVQAARYEAAEDETLQAALTYLDDAVRTNS